jgi:hypothetical protein
MACPPISPVLRDVIPKSLYQNYVGQVANLPKLRQISNLPHNFDTGSKLIVGN